MSRLDESQSTEIVMQLRDAEAAFCNLMDGGAVFNEDGTLVMSDGFWVDIEQPGRLDAAADEIEKLASQLRISRGEVERLTTEAERLRDLNEAQERYHAAVVAAWKATDVAALTAENERWKAQLENAVAAADQPTTHDGSVLVGQAWFLNVSKALDDARIAVGRLPHDTVRANEIEAAAAVASTRETQT